MRTAREWFQCLRPDLRDRAIKATKKSPLMDDGIKFKFHKFSVALWSSFSWRLEKGLDQCASWEEWNRVYMEALDIEEGRKPDIKP